MKHIVKTYDYNKRNNKDESKYLNYNYLEVKTIEELMASLYINLVKHGIEQMQPVLKEKQVLERLIESFIVQRIKYDRKEELDRVKYDESKFLLTAIDSYYSKML